MQEPPICAPNLYAGYVINSNVRIAMVARTSNMGFQVPTWPKLSNTKTWPKCQDQNHNPDSNLCFQMRESPRNPLLRDGIHVIFYLLSEINENFIKDKNA